jgi:hypothetical protein
VNNAPLSGKRSASDLNGLLCVTTGDFEVSLKQLLNKCDSATQTDFEGSNTYRLHVETAKEIVREAYCEGQELQKNYAIRLTKEQCAKIVEWFDEGMDYEWKKECTDKSDDDLRFALWLAATSDT